MTARERLASLAARLRAALADEKQRVNLLVCMGLAGLLLLAVSSWRPADSSTQSAAPAAMTDSTGRITARLQRPMPERSWMQRTFLGSTGCIK